MKTFRTFLNESAQASAIKSFDASKLDVKDILQAYTNAGYTVDDPRYFKACVYAGYLNKSHNHCYYMMWENPDADEEDTPYAISAFYIELDKDGKIVAETSGNPTADDLSEDEAERRLAKLKKS